jgi:hypothetical protein
MISLTGGWLFIHVQRTGGNSFQEVLFASSDDRRTVGKHRDGVDEYEVAGPITDRKHMTLQEYQDRLSRDTFERLFKFAVVRNPWERAISVHFCPFHWAAKPGKPTWSSRQFRHTLKMIPPMTELISVGGKVGVDAILRYENLKEDAELALARLGIGGVAFPHRNRGLTPEPWASYYEREPELIDLVAERYRADIELFGYDFAGRSIPAPTRKRRKPSRTIPVGTLHDRLRAAFR